MKYLLSGFMSNLHAPIAMLLLFAAFQQQPKPHVTTSKSSVQERNAQVEAGQKQEKLSDQHPSGKSVGRADKSNPYTPQAKPDAYDPRQDTLYRAYLWATMVGVALALGGIFAIYRQTKATQDSAKATLRSVRLQEDAQRQWLNLEDWQFSIFDIESNSLEASVGVANHTRLPLTIHGVIIFINGTRANSTASRGLLSPDNPSICRFSVSLDPEQQTRYSEGTLWLTIGCSVLFADCHGIHWQQEFERQIRCDPATRRPTGTDILDTKNTLSESGIPGERGSREVELE